MKRDRLEGRATLRYGDGTAYEGEFHGVGALDGPDGRMFMQGNCSHNAFPKGGWAELE